MTFDPKRVRRALIKCRVDAQALCRDARAARHAGNTLTYRALLESIAIHRDHIADQRLALRLGRRVEKGEGGGTHVKAFDRRFRGGPAVSAPR